MTRLRRILLSTLAAGHLGMVVVGGFDVCPWHWGAVGRGLTLYSALTGVGSGYSFFAPSVRAAPDAEFTLLDGEGRRISDTLQTRATREADIRVQDVIDVINSRRIDDRTRERIAASWAAELFARHPAAESVLVDVGHADLPKMAELREGAAPGWHSVYRARVVRGVGTGARP